MSIQSINPATGEVLETFEPYSQKQINEALDHDRHRALIGASSLREVGKRDQAALEGFLAGHHRGMPRTMLRYAIERLPEPRRRQYLQGEV